MALSEIEYKRTIWASKRGMLELDLILLPFVENRLLELSESDQRRYIRLMEEEDTDLFAWFMRKDKPEDPDLLEAVYQVIAYVRPDLDLS